MQDTNEFFFFCPTIDDLLYQWETSLKKSEVVQRDYVHSGEKKIEQKFYEIQKQIDTTRRKYYEVKNKSVRHFGKPLRAFEKEILERVENLAGKRVGFEVNNRTVSSITCDMKRVPAKNMDTIAEHVSRLPDLVVINLDSSNLSHLDTRNHKLLKYLDVSQTHVSSLDLSENGRLVSLFAQENEALISVDVSSCYHLESFFVNGCMNLASIKFPPMANNLKKIEVRGCGQLDDNTKDKIRALQTAGVHIIW